LKSVPLHIRKTTIVQAPETSNNFFEVIKGQIEYWIDDLKRKDKSIATNFSFMRKSKKEAIVLDLKKYQSAAKLPEPEEENKDEEAFIDEERTGIQELNDLTSKELQEELEKYLNFATSTSSTFDYVKIEGEFARTDLEKLQAEEKELENRENEQAAQFSSIANLLMGNKKKKDTSIKVQVQDPNVKAEINVDLKNIIRWLLMLSGIVFEYSLIETQTFSIFRKE
jgi:hypothetical protein